MTMQIKIQNCDAEGTTGRQLRVVQLEGADELSVSEVAVLGPQETFTGYVYDRGRCFRVHEVLEGEPGFTRK